MCKFKLSQTKEEWKKIIHITHIVHTWAQWRNKSEKDGKFDMKNYDEHKIKVYSFIFFS